MISLILFSTILLPVIGGILILLLPFKKRNSRLLFIECICCLTSALVLYTLLDNPAGSYTLFSFTKVLSITFKLDGVGKLFAGMAAFLWPLAVLYSFEYMKHEHNEESFFMFYIITFGVTLGIAFSANLFTMYFFFEMMSLITLPLVFHTRTREAILASRTYLYYMIGGAALGFLAMVYLLLNSPSLEFVMGGILSESTNTTLMLVMYVLAFFGFGIKTAVFPFSRWLPKAGVAPTPVTALLHAVAVVNTGAFAVMRVTYFSFGADKLRGTWAQSFCMIFVIFTIVYGCSRAVKETHLKRRLAWSTVSNLSYILFGILIMTPLGLEGAMCHMLFHSFMKITSFFCAGAIIYKTGRNYVHELDGFAHKMPRIFALFTLAALALMGVPGLAGFVSKWYLASAALESDNWLAYVGVGALLVSALLTAIYMLTITVRGYFPGYDFDYKKIRDVSDPNWMMILPLTIFAIVVVLFGLHPQPVLDFLAAAAGL